MRLVIPGNPTSANLIYYSCKITVIYGTQKTPQGVQTLPSELDWNISALLHTLIYSIHSFLPLSNIPPPPLSIHSCPHSCHFSNHPHRDVTSPATSLPSLSTQAAAIHPFTHSSSSATHALWYLASPVRVSTPPLRLVRAVRKQLMELSRAKMHHHLLYPLCDDSGDR